MTNSTRNKGKELTKNTVIIMLGKISTQFLSVFLLPLYTSFLSKEEYGTVDLILTYVGLFVPCITLQLENALFRFLIDSRDDNDAIANICSAVLYDTVLLLIPFSCIYWIVVGCFRYPYGAILYFIILFTIFSNMCLQAARGLGRNDVYSIGSVIAGLSNVLLSCLFLIKLNYGINSILYANALSNLLCAVFISLKLKLFQFIRTPFDKKVCYDAVKYSFPLVPNSIIWWIINVSDRIIVSHFLGVGANGIYAISNKFPTVIMSAVSIFNLAWTESISLHINDPDGEKYIEKIFSDVLCLIASLELVLQSGMFFLFPIVVKEGFIESYQYIPLLLLGAFFNSFAGLLGSIYVALKRTKEIADTSLAAGIINIALNLVFIKKAGIYAAAASTVISFMVLCLYRSIDLRKYIKVSINSKRLYFCGGLYILTYGVYIYNNRLVNIISFFLCIIFFVVINKDLIADFLGHGKRLSS